MVDLLVSEVNEALRQDKLTALWNTWKKPLLWACIALVVGTGLSSARQYYREQQGAKAMQQLTLGVNDYAKGDYTAAAKTFLLVRETTTGDIRDITRLWYARTLTQQQKIEDALQELTTLAQDANEDHSIWRDLACLRLEGLAAGQLPNACDATEGAVLKAQRDTWRAARLYSQGKEDAARAILDGVAHDKSASAAERAQAQSLLSVFAAVKETN